MARSHKKYYMEIFDDFHRQKVLNSRLAEAMFASELGDTTVIPLEQINTDIGSAVSFDMEFDNPVDDIIYFMSRPENFWYTCKYLFNIDLVPFQFAILQNLWTNKFPMLLASRGAGKSWVLALYGMLRALFLQGSKVVMVGAAFRQSKLLFEYMEQFWRNAPIFQSLVRQGMPSTKAGPKRDIDRCNFRIGNSEVLAIPIGDGSKIRGIRANCILSDEFASIPLEVFEVVIRGFTSVSASPQDRIANMMRGQIYEEFGMQEEADEVMDIGVGNQTIISGTAYYAFNHLYSYHQRYTNIINSCGDRRKLEEIFLGSVPEAFDWKQYSVIRIPHQLIPYGFMDEVQIAQAKATMQSSIYLMEYCACFAKDSEGFFKRSLVESCVASDLKPINLPSGPVVFSATVTGNPNMKYVYGIDPASENDNFAIVILEVHPDHNRIVYCWTVSREILRERLKNQGKSDDRSYYNYCVSKIRQLMRVFPTNHIGIDTQGGGISIMEAFHDHELISEGELPIWPYIKQGDGDTYWWEEKDKPSDGQPGLHILHMVQFANARFTNEANHSLRKAFENKTTLFPFFDAAEIGRAIQTDKFYRREYDTLEDCVMDIESLKDELSTIVHDQTAGGRDRWDTPQIKKPGGKIGRLRKDRYSALVIANMVAHLLTSPLQAVKHPVVGGYVGQEFKNKGGRLYNGPEHKVSKISGAYGAGVYRSSHR